jgi:hypothetical protein
MADNIVNFTGVTRLDLPPERIAKALLKADLDTIVVCGFTQEGEFYFSSNRADAGSVIFLLEKAKLELFKICEEMEVTR